MQLKTLGRRQYFLPKVLFEIVMDKEFNLKWLSNGEWIISINFPITSLHQYFLINDGRDAEEIIEDSHLDDLLYGTYRIQ